MTKTTRETIGLVAGIVVVFVMAVYLSNRMTEMVEAQQDRRLPFRVYQHGNWCVFLSNSHIAVVSATDGGCIEVNQR